MQGLLEMNGVTVQTRLARHGLTDVMFEPTRVTIGCVMKVSTEDLRTGAIKQIKMDLRGV